MKGEIQNGVVLKAFGKKHGGDFKTRPLREMVKTHQIQIMQQCTCKRSLWQSYKENANQNSGGKIVGST